MGFSPSNRISSISITPDFKSVVLFKFAHAFKRAGKLIDLGACANLNRTTDLKSGVVLQVRRLGSLIITKIIISYLVIIKVVRLQSNKFLNTFTDGALITV